MARETLIGTSVAGYTIDREVGEGGTSSVYDAHHPVHGRVALKILRERLRQDATAIARFEREAQLGKRIDHPNVVRTLETGVAAKVPGIIGDLPFLAIEWADGEILEKYAKQTGALARDEVATVITQLAAAVEALHCENIVHRDLKPENVIYNPETRRVKLLDFGIAAETNTPTEDRLTRAGFFVGTLMYVSPESLSGELVTPAADQYSLATIAYFLLTSSLPYSAKQPREMFTQLLTMPPIPLNQAKENLRFNAEAETTIMRGLAKTPQDRFPGVLDFAAELERTLTLPEVSSHPIDKLAGKFLRRFSRKPHRKR